MKRTAVILMILLGLASCTAGAEDGSFDTFAQDRPEKIYEDIAPGNFQQVNIGGNARSVVIRPSESENFEFYNGDLDLTHTYTVLCNENGEILDIEILMENPDEGNDILGSVLVGIPQKEFEKVEVTGDFRQVSLHAIDSDVLIHANDSSVNLDLEADRLTHNITLEGTLEGSEANTFRGVSVYFDRFPDNVSVNLNPIQGGTINDPQDILKGNGSGKPVISVSHAKEINIYSTE